MSARALLLALLLCGCAGPPDRDDVELTDDTLGWPRRFELDGGTVVVHQPQLRGWDGYAQLDAQAVVQVSTAARGELLGSATLRAQTATDFERRDVIVYGLEVLQVRFPSLAGEAAEPLAELVREALDLEPLLVSLDYALASYERSQVSTQREVQVNFDPPPIHVSYRPAILVQFLGPPQWQPIAGSSLNYAINTNWDLIHDPQRRSYFLRVEDAWLVAPDPVEGPWQSAGAFLPASFGNIPRTSDWEQVTQHLQGASLAPRDVPTVYVSSEPAELILVDGEARWLQAGSAGLAYLANTEADVFYDPGTERIYFLVAGRWFEAPRLEGPWTHAEELPPSLATIPAAHPKAHVLAAVPGTVDAEEALLLASIPRKATVDRKTTSVDVVYAGEPKFARIEGTEPAVWFASNTQFDVFRVEDRYFCCHQGVWFASKGPRGPWAVADAIPPVLYTIPVDHPKHGVTYVYVYESTPDTVVVGHTAGYLGVYACGGVIVYGTGYCWAYYYHHGYPYGWYGHYPYAYGCGAWYNHATGTYGRAVVAYGPYGGVGRAAAYNPHTGTYARAAGAWGPNGGTWAAHAYNPSTGRSAATRQSATPYAHWGQSAVRHGDDWARTAHYSDSRGQVAGYKTSGGGKGVMYRGDQGSGGIARSSDGDLYVGKDGEVYKRESDGGWSRHGQDGWEAADSRARPEAQAGDARERRASSGERPATDSPRAERQPAPRSSWSDDLKSAQRSRERARQQRSRYGSSDARRGGSYGSYGGGGRGGGGRGGGGRGR